MSAKVRKADSLGRFRCSKCLSWQFPTEFSPTKTGRTRLTSRCKRCNREVAAVDTVKKITAAGGRRAEKYFKRKAAESNDKAFCHRCDQQKNDEDFYYWNEGKSRSTYCKECESRRNSPGNTNTPYIPLVVRQANKLTNHQWYMKHRESILEKQRIRYQSNPEYFKAAWHKHRAKKVGALRENFTREAIWVRDDGVCHICGDLVTENKWELDHIIPLSKGGAHTKENVAVAHLNCNRRKHDKLLLDVFPEMLRETVYG